MKISELINRNSDGQEISKYDYKTISTQADQLYNTLLYRELYPNEDREKDYKELLEYMNYFKRLPNARKITRLQYLSRLHRLYLGNLALCDGHVSEALKHYFEVLSVADIRKKIKDVRNKKCSRIELCDLMPLVYNIEEMYRLVNLDKKADEYLELCSEAIHMWTDKMNEKKPEGFVFHPMRDSMSFSKPSYEFCCEEYYDKNIGRMNYRFNSGLDEFELIKPETVVQDGKEYIKLSYCSDLIDKERLLKVEQAKVVAEIREV